MTTTTNTTTSAASPRPGLAIYNPEGRAFQPWDLNRQSVKVPKGRLKLGGRSAVRPGLIAQRRAIPNVETLGYYRESLRDKAWVGFSSGRRGQFLVALDNLFARSSCPFSGRRGQAVRAPFVPFLESAVAWTGL